MLRGVNLGNWLVLEKWMAPDVFGGTTTEDETELCAQLGDAKFARLKAHRDTYITRADFAYLKAQGINCVRVPVPHFIFDDCEPYVGCAEYLDMAFAWGRETGISILIDLHTARDSQNGFDNGGLCGVCKWHLKEENLDHTVGVLEKLALRYRDDPALFGIEFLNEPITQAMFDLIRAEGRYLPHHPERAAGSSGVPDETLLTFYPRCYKALRKILPPRIALVFHDGFRLNLWKDKLTGAGYENLWLDTHPYVCFACGAMAHPTLKDAVSFSLDGLQQDIMAMKANHPVMVGEFCFNYPEKALAEGFTKTMRDAAIRASAACQMYAYEQADGWFFWSYKLLSEPQGWDFRHAVEHGWMPALT
jgi:glucan 1,3-beta-glucosidase